MVKYLSFRNSSFAYYNSITHHPFNCHSRTSEGFQWMVSCLSTHGHILFTLFPSYVDKTISGPKQHKFTLADQSNSQNCPTNLWVSSPNHCGLLFFSRLLPKMRWWSLLSYNTIIPKPLGTKVLSLGNKKRAMICP